MVVNAEEEVPLVLRCTDAKEKAGVGLFVDQPVGFVGPDAVREQAARTVLLVQPHIEKCAAVGGPFEAAVVVSDARIDQLAGRRLDDVDRIELRPLGIDGVGNEGVVGTVRHVGDTEIGVARGEHVAVHEDPFLAAAARHAAEERVLTARHVAGVIGEGAVRGGDGRVVLFDAPLHLGEESPLEGLRVGHHCLGVSVLGLEMLTDVGSEHSRIAHHRLPIVRTQPGVIVHALDAVMGRDKGTFQRARSSRVEKLFTHALERPAA